MDNNETYKPEEVAEILRVSLRTVNTLLKNGDIEFFRVGNRRRITKQAIQNYIDQNMNKGDMQNE
ncbi:MAG: helix-turn-helix domain-containing protein [Clostridia bacterium]|nr:helix-turn-helix domain-containing protein [Clostridia bacterium]